MDVVKSLIWQYIRSNNYYVFYLHPFEFTQEKVPVLKDLKFYDNLYLKAGIGSYANKVEQIILMLKKCNYQFVTFEELAQIMNRDSAVAH